MNGFVTFSVVVGPLIDGVAKIFALTEVETSDLTAMTDDPELPGEILRLVGFAVTLNAGTVSLIVTDGDSGPVALGPLAVITRL